MNTSLSEGEVPLSPGDARWYSLYTAKMKGLVESVDPQQGKGDSALEIFLDLKNTPEASSASSSLTSDLSQFSDTEPNV